MWWPWNNTYACNTQGQRIMRLIKPGYQILTKVNGKEILKRIEFAGRVSHKSEDKITKDSAEKFVKMIINMGHLSVIEHESFSVKFITDRGISHELVRHRLASFTQESTRYCNYLKNKFGNQLTFIIPFWLELEEGNYHILEDNLVIDTPNGILRFEDFNRDELIYLYTLHQIEKNYNELITLRWGPEKARSILPNSLKTEIVVTANLREWRHIFKERTSNAAHPQMREIMIPLLKEVKEKIPVVFDDI